MIAEGLAVALYGLGAYLNSIDYDLVKQEADLQGMEVPWWMSVWHIWLWPAMAVTTLIVEIKDRATDNE